MSLKVLASLLTELECLPNHQVRPESGPPGLRVDFTLSHYPFAPRHGKVRVKRFPRLSGLPLGCRYLHRARRKPGVGCKAFSGFAGHSRLLYGSLSGVLTLFPGVGKRGCVSRLMLFKILVVGASCAASSQA